jgi:hypothetical protein
VIAYRRESAGRVKWRTQGRNAVLFIRSSETEGGRRRQKLARRWRLTAAFEALTDDPIAHCEPSVAGRFSVYGGFRLTQFRLPVTKKAAAYHDVIESK